MRRERIWTALCRPTPPGDDPDVRLVKEGFCWPALFLPLPWLLWHRQWLGLAAYLGGALLLGGLAVLGGLGEVGEALLGGLYALAVAGIANDWRRWRTLRQGYDMVAVVAGGSLEEAERRLFQGEWYRDRRERRPQASPFMAGFAVDGGGSRR